MTKVIFKDGKRQIQRSVTDLWDIDSISESIDKVKKTNFSDATAGVLLARSLEYVQKYIYKQLNQDETFLELGISVNNIGGYSEIITSLQARYLGDFKTSGSSDSTKGIITVGGAKSSMAVMQKEATSSWSFVELAQAKMGGFDVVSERYRAHNSKYMTMIDEVGFFGINGENGLINHETATIVTATQPYGSDTNKELTDELAAFIISQRVGQPRALQCDVVAISDDLMLRIMTSNADDGIQQTIKDKLESSLGVSFVSSPKLKDAGSNGVNGKAVAFSTNEEALVFRIPIPLKFSKVSSSSNWDYSFKSIFRIAGLDVLQKNIYVLDNI